MKGIQLQPDGRRILFVCKPWQNYKAFHLKFNSIFYWYYSGGTVETPLLPVSPWNWELIPPAEPEHPVTVRTLPRWVSEDEPHACASYLLVIILCFTSLAVFFPAPLSEVPFTSQLNISFRSNGFFFGINGCHCLLSAAIKALSITGDEQFVPLVTGNKFFWEGAE